MYGECFDVELVVIVPYYSLFCTIRHSFAQLFVLMVLW